MEYNGESAAAAVGTVIDDEVEFDPELEAKMQAALELNRKLQQMMRMHEQEQVRPSRKGPPQKRSVARNVTSKRTLGRASHKKKSAPRSAGARNFTFNDGQMLNIENSNQHLLRRLSGIAVRDVRRMAESRRPRIKVKAASGINRRKKQTAIQKQNQAFAKRLASIKASGSVSRKKHKKHAKRHAQLSRNCRQLRDRPAASKSKKSAGHAL